MGEIVHDANLVPEGQVRCPRVQLTTHLLQVLRLICREQLQFTEALGGELALERVGPVAAHLSHASCYWW